MSAKLQLHGVDSIRVKPNKPLESGYYGTFYTRDIELLDAEGNVLAEVQAFGIKSNRVGLIEHVDPIAFEDLQEVFDGQD